MGFAATCEPDDLLVPPALVPSAATSTSPSDALLSLDRELKNPLSAVLGYAQLLGRWSERGDYPERDRHAIQTIIEQTNRVSGLLNELMDVTRLDEGRFAISEAPVELGLLVLQVVQDIAAHLSRHTLTFEYDEQPAMVSGDHCRLAQMIHNLVDNAIKYSPEGGSIKLRLSRKNQQLCLSIADMGLGIPAEALPRIFDRFYRAHTTTASYIGGLGVGLYLAQQIATRHRGTLTVSSTVGAGSTFTLCLPELTS